MYEPEHALPALLIDMRTLIVALLFLIYFIVFLPVMGLLFLLRRFRRELADRITFHMIRTFFRLELWVSGARLSVLGERNIPSEPALYVGNHRSYYDILSVYSLMKMPTGFVAKKEMKKFPILSQWMELVECVFLDRDNLKEGLKAILLATEKLKEGTSVMIFPEGTRNRSADKDIPGEFKEGSLKIAARAGALIVPVAIRGSENLFEEHFPMVRPAEVSVSFLPPFRTEDIPPEHRKKPAAYVRKLIEEELREAKIHEIFT